MAEWLNYTWLHFIIPLLQWGGWGLFIFLLFYIFEHGEKIDEWVTRVNKFLLWLGIRRDKKYVAGDIRSRINSASKKINKEAEGIVTKKVDIVWVDQDNIDAFLRDGKVIIRMRHYSDQDKNVVNAIMYYVKTGVLNTGKRYLSEKIQLALDLSITKKILSEKADGSSVMDYFSANTFKNYIGCDEEIKKRFLTIELMEEKGLLTRILLREIRYIGNKLYPRTPTNKMLTETERFFTFLEPFANHKVGNDDIGEWQFIDGNIQVGILFVASHDTINMHGLDPYLNRVRKELDSGCKRIYMFGRGKNNVNAVELIIESIEKEAPRVKIKPEYYFEIRKEKLPAVCAIIFAD